MLPHLDFLGVLRPLTHFVNEHHLGSSCSRREPPVLHSSLAYRSAQLSPGKNRVYIYFRPSSCEKFKFGFSYTIVDFTVRTIIVHQIPVRMEPMDPRIVLRYTDLHSRASIEDNPLKLLRVHWQLYSYQATKQRDLQKYIHSPFIARGFVSNNAASHVFRKSMISRFKIT